MSEECKLYESGNESEDDLKSELTVDVSEELKEFPHIIAIINKLREHIKRQSKSINKLRNKLIKLRKQKDSKPNDKNFIDIAIQTKYSEQDGKSVLDWGINEAGNIENLVDKVTRAAESAVEQTGFVYEKTSGLYYDYNTGYYYDTKLGLYYDGNSGTYLYYDEETKSYKFHSQTVPEASQTTTEEKNIERKSKRKSKKSKKDDEAKKCKLVPTDATDKLEDGECSDSNSSSFTEEISPEILSSNDSENEDDKDLAKTYPPCIRIIVKETTLPKLKIGSLFLIAYTGGSIGREGDHSVLIPDINISKHHAKLQYNESKKQYEIIDLGSRNGTYLNGKRLSVAKQESEPFEVTHGSTVQVGCTKLLCHIHSGYETCGHCEPGLLQQSSSVAASTTTKKSQHKSELRRLKSKFGVEKGNIESASQLAAGYQDRAQARRVNVGSLNHHAKTQQSSIDISIAKDNKGFKLLSKMGWSEGQSLGKSGDGLIEPVPLVKNASKAGLGATSVDLSELKVNPSAEKKRTVWQKTQQRYSDIPD